MFVFVFSQSGGAGAGVAVASAAVANTPQAAMGATTSEPISLEPTNLGMELDSKIKEPTTVTEVVNNKHQAPADKDVTTLEEARVVIAQLRTRYRAQSHQLLAWRRKAKAQVKKMIIIKQII